MVVDDAHLASRDFFVEVEHPVTGPLRYPGAPYRHARTPWAIRRPAPRVGEHNHEVYRDVLGLEAGQLVALERDGVV